MTLLLPHPRPRVFGEQTVRWRGIGIRRLARWPARKNADSRPNEMDWKYGDPIAESPSRNTGVQASGWSRPDSYQRRVVLFQAW